MVRRPFPWRRRRRRRPGLAVEDGAPRHGGFHLVEEGAQLRERRLRVFLPAVVEQTTLPERRSTIVSRSSSQVASGPWTGIGSACACRRAGGHRGDDREVFGGGGPRTPGHHEGGDAADGEARSHPAFDYATRPNAPRTMAGQERAHAQAAASGPRLHQHAPARKPEGFLRPEGSGGAGDELKEMVKARGLGERVMVHKTSCLKHCSRGITVAVQPDNVCTRRARRRSRGDLPASLEGASRSTGCSCRTSVGVSAERGQPARFGRRGPAAVRAGTRPAGEWRQGLPHSRIETRQHRRNDTGSISPSRRN